MLTYGLFIIIFGFGGWVLGHNYSYLFPTDMNTAERLLLSTFPCVVGSTIGFFISLPVATFLSKFLSYEYKMLEKHWDLSPFSDDETYLLRDNEGNIGYIVHPYREIQITKRKDVFSIEIVKESVPYCTCYFPVRSSFLGLFADFNDKPNKMAFVVPRETMIKKGRVDIVTKTTHELILESE